MIFQTIRDRLTRGEARWGALPPMVRGALWMILAGLLFSIMGVLVKLLGHRLESAQVAFFRAGFGFLAVLPFALRAGSAVLRPRRPWLHLLRGTIGAGGMMCGFYSLTHLPLAEATTYGFTKPLFLVLLAALFLGERVRTRRLSATLVGFVGVVVMMGPGMTAEPAALVALTGAALVAGVVVTVKLLLRSDRPITVMFWFGILSTTFTLLPAVWVWTPPTSDELLLLVLTGALGASAQGATIRAYLAAEATALAPFGYLQLLFATLLGYLVFSELPGLRTWLGAAIIILATGYIAHREAQLHRRARPQEIPPATSGAVVSHLSRD
ncbi:MAG: DMT family transporter [Candidatus Competibacteraceae bacterium]|nr:DMT family transporter [Candidatus Competibacteraceae bacterium]